MRQATPSSGRRTPNRRLDTYIDPAERVTPRESTKQQEYRRQYAHSPRYDVDYRETDVVLEKIREFEEIVGTPRQSSSEDKRTTGDRRQTPRGTSRSGGFFNEQRDAAPKDGLGLGLASATNGDVKFISTGYTAPTRIRTSSKPEEQALADNLSPEESQSESFFASSQRKSSRTPGNARQLSYSENHRLGARPNTFTHRSSTPSSTKNTTSNSFFHSPCGPMEPDGRKEHSKIWDFLDPKDDVKPPDNRVARSKNRKNEKLAMEDAYRDLMLIPPPQNQRKQPQGRKSAMKKSGNQNDYQTKLYGDRSLNETSFSTANSSHGSSASYGRQSVNSDIPKSYTETSASDYYPRSSDPYKKRNGIMKTTGNYRRSRPKGQEYYPTSDDLSSHRRVQFSKASDPEIHKGPSIFSGCGADNTQETGIASYPSDDEALERQRQELWASKLNQIFPKVECSAPGSTGNVDNARNTPATRRSDSTAGKLITGDLRQLEEIIRKQASERSRGEESGGSRDHLSNASQESRFDPVPMSKRKNYMYVAYSRFSKDANEVLQVCEHTMVPMPNRKAGEVLVKVRASTVSVSDCEARKGATKQVQLSPYIIPGTAFCGQVALTEKKPAFSKIGSGDIVISLCSSGCNARYLCIPRDSLVKVPKKVNPDEAACLAETYLMAFQILHLNHRSSMRYKDNSLRGQSILIMVGGFSDLCRALVELTNAAGADCCYVLVDDKEFPAVSSCGAVPLMKDPQQWLTLIGKQIDLMVACNDHDLRTETMTRDHLKALNSEGEIVIFGKPGDKSLPFLHLETNGPSRLICKTNHRSLKDRSHVYNVFDSWGKDIKQCKKDLEHLLKLLQTNRLRPPVLRRLPLTKVATAQSIVESKILPGFLVCLPWVHERASKRSSSFSGSRLEV